MFAQAALPIRARPKAVPLGGPPALEALAQKFGLWAKLRRLPGLDPRCRTSHGYSPELMVAQVLSCFWTGGASLADAERLNDEPLARQLARTEKFADPTQPGEWLHAQSDESIAAIWGCIPEFIAWGIARADAARWTCADRAEGCFDDTQIEVHDPSFEGAKLNYNADRALSWQTFWFGPFLLAANWGRPAMSARPCRPGCSSTSRSGKTGRAISWPRPTGGRAARRSCTTLIKRASRTGACLQNGGSVLAGAAPRRPPLFIPMNASRIVLARVRLGRAAGRSAREPGAAGGAKVVATASGAANRIQSENQLSKPDKLLGYCAINHVPYA